MNARRQLVDVVVPVFDEERTLVRTSRRCSRTCGPSFPCRFRIVIADNASTDGTPAIARGARAAPRRGRLPPARAQGARPRAAGPPGSPATRTSSRTWTSTSRPTSRASSRSSRRSSPATASWRSAHASGTTRTCAAGSSARCSRAATTCSSTPAFRAGFSDAQCGFKAIRADVARRLAAARRGRRLVLRHRAAPARRAERHADLRGAGRLDRGSRLARRPRADDRRRPRRALAGAARVLARRAAGSPARRRRRWRRERRPPSQRRGPRRSRRRLAARWHLVALGGVLAVAAFLDLFRLDRNGYANTYYAGAVRSMLAELAQLLLRLVRPGRARLGRQAAARALARGGEREDLRLLRLGDPAARGARRGRRGLAPLPARRARTSGAWPGSSAALALAVSPVSVVGEPRQQPGRAARAAARRRRLRRRAGGRVGAAAHAAPRPRSSSGSPSTRRCSRRWSSCPGSRSPTLPSPAVPWRRRLVYLAARRGRPRRRLGRLDRGRRPDPGEPAARTSARRATTARSASRSTTTGSAA